MSFKYVPILAGFFCLLSITGADAQIRQFKNEYQKRMYRYGTFSYTGGVAISSYFGDLKDNSLNLWAKPSTQLGVQYRVDKHLQLRSEIMWYRISGADSLNALESDIRTRNLSFRADNFEFNVVGIWQVFNKYARYDRKQWNPYGFAGLALTTNNPKARYQGEWYQLRPLQTEGESYSSIVFAIPLGVGLTYHVDNNWDISFEYGYRITFSDYLDDVSTFHLDPESIQDPLRLALSDRRPEIGLPRKEGGYIRGHTKADDWYLITGLKVTYTPGAAGRMKYRRPKYR